LISLALEPNYRLRKVIRVFVTRGVTMLRHKYPYLSVIGVLMYLINNTRLDIAFTMNCLARHSAAPSMRHWNIRNILRYLHGTTNLGLFFRKN
jgi:hypothetical protein